MKCQQVHEMLIAYLDNEITPSERGEIQAHLAECAVCREELAALSALQSRVSQALHIRAAQAAPSPQAWSCLQARLIGEARSLSRLGRSASVAGYVHQILKGGITMKRGFALAAIAALVIALSVTAFAPSVWAQVGELLRWFRFESPAGGGEVSIPGSVKFTPLRPVYLPAGFQTMAVGLNPEAASLNYWNSAANQILVIDQRQLAPGEDKSLPPGAKVTINGQPAVLVTGLRGNVDFVSLPPTPFAPIATPAGPDKVMPLEPVAAPAEAETVSYIDGKQLIWYADNVRIEMLSNLPEEEMLKIAESLAPAESSAP